VGRNLSEQITSPQFISDLRGLADAGLVLETANPNAALIGAVVRLSDQVPSLRLEPSALSGVNQFNPNSIFEAAREIFPQFRKFQQLLT
jgi:hypothetical protein